MSKGRGLLMDVREGETVRFTLKSGAVDSGEILVTLESKSGRVARMRVQAGDAVTVGRPEKLRELTPQ